MKKYQFRAFASLNLSNAQSKLIQHAKKVGMYENFGQEVVNFLKDKLDYNPYSHEPKQKSINSKIENLDKWCANYCG